MATKDFGQDLGRHSRRKPVGKTVASPDDLQALRKENERLHKEIIELKESLRFLSEVKSKESKASSKVKSDLNKSNSSDVEVVFKNKDLQSVDAIKLFNAIRSEEVNQDRLDVKMSRKLLVSRYGMNEAKVTVMRNALFDNGFIDVINDGRSYRFRVLKELPTFS